MTEPFAVSRLDKLAYDLQEAKRVETMARDSRLAIEEQICIEVGVKREGSNSKEGDFYRLTTSAGFIRTLDPYKWQQIKCELPEEITENIVRTKFELNALKLKKLEKEDPGTYATIAEAITTKPRKVAVSFKQLKSGS